MSFLDNIYRKLPFLGQPPTITSGQKEEQAPVPEASREMEGVNESATVRIPKRDVDAQGNERERPVEKCEDATYADDHFAVTADGVGGGGHGEIASKLAVEAAVATLKQEQANGVRGTELMKKVMQAAALEVVGDRHLHPERRAMNTTFTAVLLENGQGGRMEGTLGHVGDSRAYLFRPETGALEKLSHDDGITTLLSEPDLGPLTEEQQQFLSAVFDQAPLSIRQPETTQIAGFIDQTEKKGADVSLPPPKVFADEVMRYYGLLDSLMEQLHEREEFPARNIDQQTNAQLIDRLDRVRIDLLEVVKQMRQGSGTTGEILFRMRNMIHQALATSGDREPEHHISTFEPQPGDVVFTISDGIGDVLTETRIQQMLDDGLKQNKTTQEIFGEIAAAARSDVSQRQKGKAIQKNAEGQPLLFEGDDIGIAGLRVFEKKEARQSPAWEGKPSEPLILAEDFEEDPGSYGEKGIEFLERKLEELHGKMAAALHQGVDKKTLQALNQKLERFDALRREMVEQQAQQAKKLAK